MWRERDCTQKLQGLSNYTHDAGMQKLGFKAKVPCEVGPPVIDWCPYLHSSDEEEAKPCC